MNINFLALCSVYTQTHTPLSNAISQSRRSVNNIYLPTTLSIVNPQQTETHLRKKNNKLLLTEPLL